MQDPLDLITAGVAALAERDAHGLPDSALLETTETILTVINRLNGVLARQLQVIHVRDATVAEYGRKTRSWLVEDCYVGHDEATKLISVAKALPTRLAIAAALLAGDITLEHARNIATSTKKVPVDIQELFEKELVKAAAFCDPTTLGVFARELRNRLGGDETAEAAEQRRYDSRWVTVTKTFDGMHRLDGMLDPAGAAVVQTALAPLCRKTAEHDDRSVGQRRADALVTIANHALNAGGLPEIGGEKPHLVCTIWWEQLKADLDARLAAGAQPRIPRLRLARLPNRPPPLPSSPHPPRRRRRADRRSQRREPVLVPPLARPPQQLENHQAPRQGLCPAGVGAARFDDPAIAAEAGSSGVTAARRPVVRAPETPCPGG